MTLLSWEDFQNEFTNQYGDPNREETASIKLHQLKQGGLSLRDYTTQFLTLSTQTRMEDQTLKLLYKIGLSKPLINRLATIPPENIPNSFAGFRNYVATLNQSYLNTIALHSSNSAPPNPPKSKSNTPNPSSNKPNPPASSSTTSKTASIPEEFRGPLRGNPGLRAKLEAANRCLFCRKVGHKLENCRDVPKRSVAAVSSEIPVSENSSSVEEIDVSTSLDTAVKDSHQTTDLKISKITTIPLIDDKQSVEEKQVLISSLESREITHFMLPIVLKAAWKTLETSAMIDSGATGKFINSQFVKQMSLPVSPFKKPVSLKVVDGRPIGSGLVLEKVVISLTINEKYFEKIPFLVTDLGKFDIILGLPWLEKHNPTIDWKQKILKFQSSFCKENCHPSPTPQKSFKKETSMSNRDLNATNSISAEIIFKGKKKEDRSLHPDYPKNLLPKHYLEFEDVFSKKTSDRLPKFRGGYLDHKIPLEINTQPPFLSLRNQSPLELKTVKDYINENLAKGWIRPSTFSAGAPHPLCQKERWILEVMC
jgi:hypothetical protein